MRTALASILFVWLVSVGVVFSAQEVYSQKERDQFRANVEEGCMVKQSREEGNAQILPAVLEEMCKCYANKTTAQVFGSMEFQLARSRKDDEATKRVISQIVTPEAAALTSMACLQASIDERGGPSKITRDVPYSPSRTQIGLKGEPRRSFVNTGLQSCKTNQKQMPENKGITENTIDVYCACYINYLADRVSIANTVDMLTQQPSAVRKLSKASAKYCNKKLFGVKSK